MGLAISKADRNELKAIKSLFDTATYHREREQSGLSDKFENNAQTSLSAMADRTGLNFNLLVDLVFDFDYTVEVYNYTVYL